MRWHFYSMYGMGGPMTDPGEANFAARVKHEIPEIEIHGSPYRDEQAGQIAAAISALPEQDGVFVAGTSLGSNNVAVVCSFDYIKGRRIDGAFGFQASIYGARGYAIQDNVKFAHLIYSYNPVPLPGLGAYIWPLGAIPAASYHRTPHHIPHPGDYDLHDQLMFINEMKNIIAHTGQPS